MPDVDAAPHRRRSGIARLPVIGAVAVVLVAGLLIGRHGTPAARRPAPALTGPEAAPASALSSTWFCGGATAKPGGDAPGDLVITDAGTARLTASVTLVPSKGGNVTRRVDVGPASRVTVPESVRKASPWIGAVVELDGGAASVEQQISTPLGTSATPCATAGASSWYFAAGLTYVNADSVLDLLNPYPSPAIVDLSFTTDEGVEQPQAFQGIVVAPDSLVAVDLRSHLRRRSAIATTVTATAGRLVAWKTDTVEPPASGTPLAGTKAARAAGADPAWPYLGVTDVLGTPSPSTTWEWPEGGAGSGVNEQYLVYDPGGRTAQVSLSVTLDQGSAEPIQLTVGPGEVADVDMATEARIPPGIGYSVALRSLDGVPVVAERTLQARPPARTAGSAELFGASGAARTWLVGAGGVTGSVDELLVASNASAHPVQVTVDELAHGRSIPLPGLSSVRVGARGRLQVDLGRLARRLAAPLVVSASGPVVVERDLVGRAGTRGIGLSLGVPLG